MATNFYKSGNSYYTAGTNQKILNLPDLQTLAKAGGKEIAAPTTQTVSPPTGVIPIPGAQYNTRDLQRANFTNIQPIGNTLYGTPIKRNDAGGFDVQAPPSSTRLDQWKNGTLLVESAKKIIQMKQNYNNDIQAARKVYRDQALDTSTWGGVGGRGQAQFSELAPAEQANLREAKWRTAEVGLAGLKDEETYRAASTKDTLEQVRGFYNDQIKALEKEKSDANEKERIRISQEQLNLERLKVNVDLGIQNSAKELFGSENSADFSRIGFKEGGDFNWRANNPGAMNYGTFAASYGAIKGPEWIDKDGKKYNRAIFPDWESGVIATKALLKSPDYQKLTVEQAIRKWSGGGYGAEVFDKSYANNPFSTITDQMLDKLIEKMIVREGGRVGKNLTPTLSNIKLTESEKKNIIEKTGLSAVEVSGLTPDTAQLILDSYRAAFQAEATDYIIKGDPEKGIKPLVEEIIIRGNKITQPTTDQIIAYLKEKYKGKLDDNDIAAIMSGLGVTKSGAFLPTYSGIATSTLNQVK